MKKYIPLDALVAEIERRRESNAKEKFFGRLVEDNYFLDFLNTLEVKGVDLVKEYRDFVGSDNGRSMFEIAKHFFELGMRVSNPITATDKGTAEEIIINLKRVEQDYHISLAKEIEWLRNKIQKGE